jgi:hypothetical protein
MPGLSHLRPGNDNPESVTRLFSLLLATAAIAAAAATQAGRATTSVLNCGSSSIGPGGTEHGATTGSRCLLRAYVQHCQPAVYGLSLFGIDTIANDRFRLERLNGRCLVSVTISFRVVPQPARQHTGVCRTLTLTSRHVVAARCTGPSIPATIVLDPQPQ